jgi:hypothetical protein
MKRISMLPAMLICLMLVISSAASAAIPCCMMDGKQQETAAASSGQDMPCHKPADSASQDAAECEAGECQDCGQTNALLIYSPVKTRVSASIAHPSGEQRLGFAPPDPLFQPPKSHS